MSGIHLSDIFTSGYKHYCSKYGETKGNTKIAHAITACRTEQLGGHLYQCPSCNDHITLYNSCSNRHCPRCQTLARREWVQARENELLPVPYFHVVFTIPSELNPFALRNKKAFYSLLFLSVNETMQELGATLPFSWSFDWFYRRTPHLGQALMDHPHIHCIVPAGGLSRSGKNWIPCKNQFLFPFKVMKKLFSSKVLAYFKEAVDDGTITLNGTLNEFASGKKDLAALLKKLYKTKWVIFVKQPFASPLRVIQYLGNYTHRIAIAESRLVQHDQKSVTFRYKDYSQDGKQKVMTLDTTEFIRRFLLHILPSGFMRIRHFGFLSNSTRKKNRIICESIFKSMKKRESSNKSSQIEVPWHKRIEEQTGVNPLLCKSCGNAVLVVIKEFFPLNKKDCNDVISP